LGQSSEPIGYVRSDHFRFGSVFIKKSN
jgi:hypothetical protein